jgi:hypothetical protein
MVKDECDIISDWINYHGILFGYENLYIINNNSTDGTYEIMNEFLNKGIHIFNEEDYNKKGSYMRKLINSNCKNKDIAFPLDIDEFIVYYDNNSDTKNIFCDKKKINDYINNLSDISDSKIYKANYIISIITDEGGYKRATKDNKWGKYLDYKDNAKSFFRNDLYNGVIDHGNHINDGSKYFMTNICLVHFHCRNLEQIKKKIFNNVNGFNYTNDLDKIRNILSNNPNCSGNHHLRNYISILEGKYKINIYKYENNLINLEQLNNFFI